MEIITGKKEELIKMLNRAYRDLEKCKSLVDRYALIDYIRQLHDIINLIPGEETYIDARVCFGTNKRRRHYDKYIDKLFDVLDGDFIANRDFHREYMGQILDISGEVLADFKGLSYSEGDRMFSQEEFYQLFFEFLQRYGLEDRFDRFIKKRRIFSLPENQVDRCNGQVIHNPLNYDSAIIISDFKCCLDDILTMSHEFGHTYDLSKIKGRDSGYRNLRYDYSSIYGEVVSTTFEKLFIDFLLEKGIKVDQVKDAAIDLYFDNLYHVQGTYFLSLLDDEDIWEGAANISSEKLVKKISPFLISDGPLNDFFKFRTIDSLCDPKYAYADVISEFLKQDILEEGLECESMQDFMKIREKTFSPTYLEEKGFYPDAFQKKYIKNINRLKK